MDNLKSYWHVLTVPFVLFTAWLWMFPMYGPLLANLAGNTSYYFIVFLLSHALGLLFYSFILEIDKEDFNLKRESKIILSISLFLLFLTICCPYLPVNYFIILMIIIGLLSGPLVVFYFYYLSITILDGTRGRILGSIFFMAGLIFMFFLLVPYGKWMFFVTASFLLGPLLLLKYPLPLEVKQDKSRLNLDDTKKAYWFSLILLIILFYFCSGLMYNLLYTDIMTVDGGFFDIGFIFYPLVVLPAGFLADKMGRKMLISLGLSLAGTGFLFLLLFDTLNSISMVLLQSSFAVMDIYIFLTLMDWTYYFSNRKMLGAGLFLNVIVIFLSSLPFMEYRISETIPEELWPAVGLVLILLIIPFMNFIKETGLIRQGEEVSKKDDMNIDSFCDKYSISPREKEVILFLLEGKKTGEITELLSISYNTLKTHLRNIYRKTNTGGQKDLILFIWKSLNSL